MAAINRVETPRNRILVIPRQVPGYLELVDCIYEYADAYTSSYSWPHTRLVRKAWLDVIDSADQSFKLWPDAEAAIIERMQADKKAGSDHV